MLVKIQAESDILSFLLKGTVYVQIIAEMGGMVFVGIQAVAAVDQRVFLPAGYSRIALRPFLRTVAVIRLFVNFPERVLIAERGGNAMVQVGGMADVIRIIIKYGVRQDILAGGFGFVVQSEVP